MTGRLKVQSIGQHPDTKQVSVVFEPPQMNPYGAPQPKVTGLNRRLRAKSLSAIRTYGAITSDFRMSPDYFIIGTKRGGTTSLARWLLDHPGIRPLFPAKETRKGTYFFDVNYDRGEAWYRSHFPTRRSHQLVELARRRNILVGEATPYYLHHPHAATRARAMVPDAKVIALLRNPIERAHGHWAERFRQGVEYLGFEDALAAEPGRLAGEEERMIDDPSYVSFAHQHFSYADQGRYARGLMRWLNAYPSQNVLVLRAEDLYADPMAVYLQVLRFLGLESHRPSELKAWNLKSKSPLSSDIREQLQDLLAPDIAQTEAVLGRSMDWI